MLAQAMVELGKKRSTIREIFEYGNQRAKIVGRENIFDFSKNILLFKTYNSLKKRLIFGNVCDIITKRYFAHITEQSSAMLARMFYGLRRSP